MRSTKLNEENLMKKKLNEENAMKKMPKSCSQIFSFFSLKNNTFFYGF